MGDSNGSGIIRSEEGGADGGGREGLKSVLAGKERVRKRKEEYRRGASCAR